MKVVRIYQPNLYAILSVPAQEKNPAERRTDGPTIGWPVGRSVNHLSNSKLDGPKGGVIMTKYTSCFSFSVELMIFMYERMEKKEQCNNNL